MRQSIQNTETSEILHKTILLATSWQNFSTNLLTKKERKQQQMMRRMLNHPSDKTIILHLMDQSFRSENSKRAVNQFQYLLQQYGIPHFFPKTEQWLLKIFLKLGHFFPKISHSQILRKIHKDASRNVLSEESKFLKKHLKKRKAENIEVNLNHLGESVLGDGEAKNRLQHYASSLRNPEINTISIKISNLAAQLHPLGFDDELDLICERLGSLYRVAMQNPVYGSDGSRKAKFINLDMESYYDLDLTMSAFMRVLDKLEFKNLSAGIVLQAYLPDSFLYQQRLVSWAKNRLSKGGSPVKMRLVKGANLAMEKLESELSGWQCTVFDSKIETDANFKRMLEFALKPQNIKAVHLGLASHNLFDLAYTYCLAEQLGIKEGLVFEMLEGMGEHYLRTLKNTLKETAKNLKILLYTPVASKKQFIHSIAYLVRRLDENTGYDNFLRHSFDMQVGSNEWKFLEKQFLSACSLKDRLPFKPRRKQNRTQEIPKKKLGTFAEPVFQNEPDTDWVLPKNREWANQIRQKWQPTKNSRLQKIPLILGKKVVQTKRKKQEFFDPSNPQMPAVFSVALATKMDVKRAVKIAKDDASKWRKTTLLKRHKLLEKVAHNLRKKRGDLIGIAAAVCAKTFYEADTEISEAIDFIEYYPHSLSLIEKKTSIKLSPLGVILVISPWNFPIAISSGGIAASLAAGNTVLFKPSPLAFPVAAEIVKCFWDAGISREVLQLITCEEGEAMQTLSRDSGIHSVIFTGGTETALKLLAQRPDQKLVAETGGKNAMIVTAMADRDQAVEHILHSAFSHSGQKCSATSLLILEKEIYEDSAFRKQLLDAIRTLKVGSVWNFANKMGPLIRKPMKHLRKGLKFLEAGESWALAPKFNKKNPKLMYPTVKWGVKSGSFSHRTEFFFPLLSVMKAESLEDAIEIANRTGYGLTAGLESLDFREQKIFSETIEAGNLYINRTTTGAIVLRQPFGGIKLSSIGSGIKAGGPNYAIQFCEIEDGVNPTQNSLQEKLGQEKLGQEKLGQEKLGQEKLGQEKSEWFVFARNWQKQLAKYQHLKIRSEFKKIIQAIYSCLYNYEQEFSKEQDFFSLAGQSNLFRYHPIGKVAVRLHAEDSLFETLIRIAAASIAKCKVEVSFPPNLKNSVTQFLVVLKNKHSSLEYYTESDKELSQRLVEIDRLRYAHPQRVPSVIYRAAAKLGKSISRDIPLMEGRIEMLRYLYEQSLSVDYHRYGNLGRSEK